MSETDEIDEYWTKRLYPKEKLYFAFITDLTKWYFTELLSAYGCSECNFINFDALVDTGSRNLVYKIMEFENILTEQDYKSNRRFDHDSFKETIYSQEIGKQLSPDSQTRLSKAEDLIGDLYADFSYDLFHDNFPFFTALFKMVQNSIKVEYPNGDCYCGSSYCDINVKANLKLFIWVYDNLVSNE